MTRMNGRANRNRFLLACLASFFLFADGKSLRRHSRQAKQHSSNQIIDKRERDLQTALQRIRSPHRRLQEEESELELELDTNTTAPGEEEDVAAAAVFVEGEEEDSTLQLETNTTVVVEEDESALLLDTTTTRDGEAGSSPFSFGTGNGDDEQPSPFLFGVPQTTNEEPQAETEDIPPVTLDVEPANDEALSSVNSTEPTTNEAMPANADLENAQPGQEEYMNFHFGAGQMHNDEHYSVPLNEAEEQTDEEQYVDGTIVDQFAHMFNMVHGNTSPMDPYPSSSSTRGKGSIYYDEFGSHGKGGKGKGGNGKASTSHKGGKGGGMPHDSDPGANMGSNDGAEGGPSGSYKRSKKSSSSESRAYRREHRLTMPPMETNSHGGGSSEKSRR